MEEVLNFLDVPASDGEREFNVELMNDAKNPNLVYMVVTSLGTLYTINSRAVMLKRMNQENQPNRLVLQPKLHIERFLREDLPLVELVLLNDAEIRPHYCHRAILSGYQKSAVKCSSMFLFGSVKLVIGTLQEEIEANAQNRAHNPKTMMLDNNEKLKLLSTTFDVRIGSSEHRIYVSVQQSLQNVRFDSSPRIKQFRKMVAEADTDNCEQG